MPPTEYREAANRGQPLSPIFFAAAWELCRRGILRPGIHAVDGQANLDSQAGSGYSLTPLGRQWLEEIDDLQFIPTEPGAVSEILARFLPRFGVGFHQRAQEASKCYFATAYLGCCAMCGAAAESILLAAAIAKTADEAAILKTYKSASGRKRVEDGLIGQAARANRTSRKSPGRSVPLVHRPPQLLARRDISRNGDGGLRDRGFRRTRSVVTFLPFRR